MTWALNCALSYTLNSFCQDLKIIDRTCKYAIAQNKMQKPEIVRPTYSGILKLKQPQKSWVRPWLQFCHFLQIKWVWSRNCQTTVTALCNRTRPAFADKGRWFEDFSPLLIAARMRPALKNAFWKWTPHLKTNSGPSPLWKSIVDPFALKAKLPPLKNTWIRPFFVPTHLYPELSFPIITYTNRNIAIPFPWNSRYFTEMAERCSDCTFRQTSDDSVAFIKPRLYDSIWYASPPYICDTAYRFQKT
jgi:hypothetical protein